MQALVHPSAAGVGPEESTVGHRFREAMMRDGDVQFVVQESLPQCVSSLMARKFVPDSHEVCIALDVV